MTHTIDELQSVLVVADWKADASAVVAACIEHAKRAPSSFTLLVPAWLHGLDWVGDPYGSVPCATRALRDLARRAELAGLRIDGAQVGDPDPIAAIADAVLDRPFDRLLLCASPHRLAHRPRTLAERAARLTGVPTTALPVATGAERRPTVSSGLLRGHCAAPELRAA